MIRTTLKLQADKLLNRCFLSEGTESGHPEGATALFAS